MANEAVELGECCGMKVFVDPDQRDDVILLRDKDGKCVGRIENVALARASLTVDEGAVERVARALAIQNGRAKGNCDCKRCLAAVEYEQDNARAAIAALQKEPPHEG